MMRWVLVKRSFDDKEVYYATNKEYEGFFFRFPHQNAWSQTRGTGQFRARTEGEMVKWLKNRGIVTSEEDVLDSHNWED